VSFVTYDNKGNLITQQKTDDLPVTYLWGYHKRFPVAEVKNAPDTTTVFYTSFEDDGNYTAVAYTGEKARQGQYTVTLPATNGNYKVTYMKWAGGSPENWQYITQDVAVTTGTAQTLVIGTAPDVIDEVRLYPAGAWMTTYSYKPEIGITSSADQNSVVMYYEYDSFGRLKYLKDARRNILKSYEYNYQGQSGSGSQ
jgi:hypothetical protein